jgi:hypothetical protein
MSSIIKSTIKYLYNLYKKLQTGCNSTEVLNSVEKQTDEIIVSVTSEVNDITTERTRANTVYQETLTTINEDVEKIEPETIQNSVIESIQESVQDSVIEPIQESIIESIQESVIESIQEQTSTHSEPIEDQQSDYSSIHSPPPSPELSYDENETEIIGVVDTAGFYNKFI